jgi:hypothetical protein
VPADLKAMAVSFEKQKKDGLVQAHGTGYVPWLVFVVECRVTNDACCISNVKLTYTWFAIRTSECLHLVSVFECRKKHDACCVVEHRVEGAKFESPTLNFDSDVDECCLLKQVRRDRFQVRRRGGGQEETRSQAKGTPVRHQ